MYVTVTYLWYNSQKWTDCSLKYGMHYELIILSYCMEKGWKHAVIARVFHSRPKHALFVFAVGAFLNFLKMELLHMVLDTIFLQSKSSAQNWFHDFTINSSDHCQCLRINWCILFASFHTWWGCLPAKKQGLQPLWFTSVTEWGLRFFIGECGLAMQILVTLLDHALLAQHVCRCRLTEMHLCKWINARSSVAWVVT